MSLAGNDHVMWCSHSTSRCAGQSLTRLTFGPTLLRRETTRVRPAGRRPVAIASRRPSVSVSELDGGGCKNFHPLAVMPPPEFFLRAQVGLWGGYCVWMATKPPQLAPDAPVDVRRAIASSVTNDHVQSHLGRVR